jgi:streptogramin lyase
MRRLVPTVAVLVALGAGLLPAAAGATPVGRTTLYPLREGTEAEALAVGPEGYLWYAGSNRGARPSNVVGNTITCCAGGGSGAGRCATLLRAATRQGAALFTR